MVYFGIVRSDQIEFQLLRTTDEASVYPIAIRDIKWYRKCNNVRDLPHPTINSAGTKHIKWLSESCPNPIVNLTKPNKNKQQEALQQEQQSLIDTLSSDEFWNKCTKSV